LHHLELWAGTALLVFAEALADIVGGDCLAANSGNGIGGRVAAIAGHRRHEIEEHAAGENENYGAEKNARKRFLLGVS